MNVWNATITYAQHAITQHANRLYQSLQAANTGNLPSEAGSVWWAAYEDPISKVYNALWSLLESHAPLASMVPAGNRVKYSGDNRDPEKAQISSNDTPELRLTSVGSTPHLQRTSSSTSIAKRFRVEVSTGDQRFDAGLYAIEWEVNRAMLGWESVLTALTWQSQQYVKSSKIISTTDGKTERDLERGIRGWASVWECEIEMWFRTSDMQS